MTSGQPDEVTPHPQTPELTPAQRAMDERDWTFGGTWPYEPRWLFTDDVRVHYVDEGPRAGRPVVMVHGNPTWGYLFRHLIPELTERGHRVIAPDGIGFGRSDKPQKPSEYSLRAQVRHFAALMRELDLQEPVLVLHDWGGPTGLAWAVDHPSRLGGLVLTNTFTGSAPAELNLPLSLRLQRGRGTGEVLVKALNAPVRRGIFRRAGSRARLLGPDEQTAYLAPHPSFESRTGVLAFVRMIGGPPSDPANEIAARIEAGLSTLVSLPTALCWGLADPLGIETLAVFEEAFPDAAVTTVAEAGHLLPEDAPEALLRAVCSVVEAPRPGAATRPTAGCAR